MPKVEGDLDDRLMDLLKLLIDKKLLEEMPDEVFTTYSVIFRFGILMGVHLQGRPEDIILNVVDKKLKEIFLLILTDTPDEPIN